MSGIQELNFEANEPEPTSCKPDIIKAINKDTVHKICSGQVVLSLSIAVKELIENSIDAKASNIEIRLKDSGSEFLSVSDNGTGVEEQNFQALTLKHHTSKLREFSDLYSVETFGFRGEALSSLCALANLTVITKHSSAVCATKIEYDFRGNISKKSPCSRQQGTTVILENLFSSLPVRRKEFLRNLKKEFSKMVQIVQAYCIISSGIRIRLINLNKKSETVITETFGSKNLIDNISSVFGIKQIKDLLKFKESSKKDCEETVVEQPFNFEGYISSCGHSLGRSAPDRQFYFINSRPCDPSHISKLINEIYHQYNRHQYPFVCLNIKIERTSVDVNLTPDKRKILLNQEKIILESLRGILIEMYQNIPSICISISKSPTKTPETTTTTTKSVTPLQRLQSFAHSKHSIQPEQEPPAKRRCSQTNKITTNFAFKIENKNEEEEEEETKVENFSIKIESKEEIVSIDKEEIKTIAKKNEEEIVKEKELIDQDPIQMNRNRIAMQLDIDLERVKARFKSKRFKDEQEREQKLNVKFRATIDPKENQEAEDELNKYFSKQSFSQMQVIGQFNLGFIVALLDGDIFIVDQHASDEKYNFEKLEKETKLQHQPLVVPQSLELTYVNENVVIENIEIFKQNGFDFEINEKAEPMKRVKLIGIPMSRNWHFGKDDIDEMIFMLQDSPNTMCRPTRVRDMLASRACRKSVMVGTALTKSQMQTLLSHMTQMDQPWNCPHGRPTMRHLINLNLLDPTQMDV